MTAAPYVDPRAGLVRGVRAAILTVPTVGGAAIAHSLVDGCDSVFALLLAVGVCWPAAVAVLGSRRRLPAFTGWVVLAQVATHLLLEAMCTDVTAGRTGWAQHLLTGVTPAMLLTHGTAVLLTSVLLGRADACLWAADALVRAGAKALRLLRVLVPPSLPAPVRRTAPLLAVEFPRSSWVAAQPARRGPPVLLACAQ
ncbi:MAG: hypothetical protein JWP14_2827 [Frankiales bacterium]|nr:hypothetical protein [Frankiales bacterium]